MIARLIILLTIAYSARAAELLVAAASDLAPLASALESGFAQSTGHKVRFTFGSSGSLARQIENGAPYDVFLAASESYARELADSANTSTTTVYALGRIALWSLDGGVHQLSDLGAARVKQVAMANPLHAPYGAAAKLALERQNLWQKVEPKLVFGENVRQALQFAESGNADAVITSWTLLQGRGILLPAEWHDPIRQTGVLVKSSSQPETGMAFLAYLVSPAGQAVLTAGGLFPLNKPAPPPKSAPLAPAPVQKRPSSTRRSSHR